MLLRDADRKMGLTELMAGLATDRRQPKKVRHAIKEMIRERVYAIGLGYEDANDLDLLNSDPALKSACGKLPSDHDLASQPTISRPQNSVTRKDLLEMAFRADGSFGVEDVISWCEGNDVDYVLGLSTNKKLAELSTPVQMDAALKYKWEGDGCREYDEFGYQAKTWARERRVIVKAEITGGGACAPLCSDKPGEVSPEGLRVLLSSRRSGEPYQGDEAGSRERSDELPQVSCEPVSASPAQRRLRANGNVAGGS